ncbi:hypothetical protein [Polluticoccus soli]|uniref:hypothetical protein n=1 Tax=Polluticoccus soli TaxID=3034150 RepID=UPI0023E21DBA|nr:hypothetical protein [Flavipsychrobacter sp. JY13-12]
MTMKTTVLFACLLAATACKTTSIEKKIYNDPRFTSGKEYGAHQFLEPKIFRFGDYSFAAGFSDSAANLAMYYGETEILSKTSLDGYFDSVAEVTLNDDGISDFLIYNKFEDGTDIYSLESTSKTAFTYQLQGSEND